jgi:hypothetical protein
MKCSAERDALETKVAQPFRLTFPIALALSSDKSKRSWTTLVKGLGTNRKEVPVGMGLINGTPLASSSAEFVRIKSTGLIIFLGLAIVLGVGFLLVAAKTGTLREKEPVPLPNFRPTDRAFSLTRTQIALWTLLVGYAYLFIGCITGKYKTEISRAILAILGISAGTYATAAAVDKGKEQGSGGGTTVSSTEGPVPDISSIQDGAGLATDSAITNNDSLF